jgi:3-oxoacyl-[acyl-carrier protein] reductase
LAAGSSATRSRDEEGLTRADEPVCIQVTIWEEIDVDLGIAGKTALVSGGSKGIGGAIARELAAEGARVVVTARGQEAIDQTVARIEQSGGTASGIAADFTTKSGIDTAVSHAEQTYGPVDIAVFNVYGPRTGRYEETSDDDFLMAYNDMVMALHWMTQRVLPGMRKAGWGRLVNVNSIGSKEVHRELPLFTANATRVAAVSFNKTLSAEVGPDGITVNTLGTGGFMTERYREYMTSQAQSRGDAYDEFIARRRDDIPVGRLGDPEEMAAVAAFLCSTRASFVTGQFIVVDGGKVRTLW